MESLINMAQGSDLKEEKKYKFYFYAPFIPWLWDCQISLGKKTEDFY